MAGDVVAAHSAGNAIKTARYGIPHPVALAPPFQEKGGTGRVKGDYKSLMTDQSKIRLKLVNRDLYLNGNLQPIRLRPKEAQLLAALLARPNEPISRATLMREVWETDFVDDTRTLEVHIHGLRRIIEENPRRPRLIVTVRGLGYCLVVE